MSVRLENVRLRGELTSLYVVDGRLAPEQPCAASVDLGGRVVVPGFVDAHCHLDKTLWSGPWVPNTAGPGLHARIAYTRAGRAAHGVPSAPRIAALLEAMSAAGTTHVRTHTDVSPEFGLDGFEAVAAAAAVVGRVAVQQVAFPQYGLISNPGTLELMDRALGSGLAQVAGGIDPAGIDGDADAHLAAVFGLAVAHDVPVDIHLHDGGILGRRQLRAIAEATHRHGRQGRVTISHGYALAEAVPAEQDDLVRLLADAGIALTTCAAHDDPVAPVRALRAAGARVGLGSDGIRDLWSPWGNGDLLDRAHLLAYRSSFHSDPDIAMALDVATRGGAAVLDLPGHTLAVGEPADLVVLDAQGEAEAVVTRASRHLVLRDGIPVAGTDRLPYPDGTPAPTVHQ